VSQVSEPRDPVQIAHQLLSFIEEKGRANRWDLIKILGSNTRFYSLTPNGELLLRLLKNGNVMRSITRLGGRRLRRSAL